VNAGFSNLTSLKAYLLAAKLRATTDYDYPIQNIGLGVATTFERVCNREFAYAQNILEVFQGDRPFWYARRAPVSIFSKVELRFFRADNWTDISGQPVGTDEEKGMIHFGYTLGKQPMQARLTYNGGFFWEQLEPTDAGYPTAVPDDIANNSAGLDPNKFMLPADLLSAWQIQCEITWKMRDKLGLGIVGGEPRGRGPLYAINDLDLAPVVKTILGKYVRYQLT